MGFLFLIDHRVNYIKSTQYKFRLEEPVTAVTYVTTGAGGLYAEFSIEERACCWTILVCRLIFAFSCSMSSLSCATLESSVTNSSFERNDIFLKILNFALETHRFV